jgi:hypothetical protein
MDMAFLGNTAKIFINMVKAVAVFSLTIRRKEVSIIDNKQITHILLIVSKVIKRLSSDSTEVLSAGRKKKRISPLPSERILYRCSISASFERSTPLFSTESSTMRYFVVGPSTSSGSSSA